MGSVNGGESVEDKDIEPEVRRNKSFYERTLKTLYFIVWMTPSGI